MKIGFESLIEKIEKKDALIGIVGLGYVGSPLTLSFKEAGFSVTGFDVDDRKLALLQDGNSCFQHISSKRVREAVSTGLELTSDFSNIREMDAILLCLPTPLTKNREPDLSHVTDTLEKILPYSRPRQIISLESTTYPGTTDEEIVRRIDAAGLECGVDYFVVYSPEREDPGNKDFMMSQIPKVVGGYTEQCSAVGLALYQGVFEKVHGLIPESSRND